MPKLIVIETVIIFMASLVGCLFKEFFLNRHKALNKNLLYEYVYIPILSTLFGLSLLLEIELFKGKILLCTLITWVVSIFISPILKELFAIKSLPDLIALILISVELSKSIVSGKTKDIKEKYEEKNKDKKD